MLWGRASRLLGRERAGPTGLNHPMHHGGVEHDPGLAFQRNDLAGGLLDAQDQAMFAAEQLQSRFAVYFDKAAYHLVRGASD